MRQIILNLAVSLDGFIAGPRGEYDWCLTDDDYGMTAFLESVDSLLIGRKSYEIVLEYGPPYPEKTNFVFSRTLKNSPFKNVVIVPDDVALFAGSLKKQSGKNIWLFGGGEIIQELYDHDLIDEWVLSIHPVLLGDGIPLIKKGSRKNLKLKNSIRYPSGLIQCTYQKQ